MFDILKAKESFMNYVRQFDLTNDKIHLKLVHTLEVVRTTEYLCPMKILQVLKET